MHTPWRILRLLPLLLVLTLALSACDDSAGGDGGGGGGPDPIAVDLTGDWRGTARSTVNPGTDTVTAVLAQGGNQFTGEVTFTNSPCFQRGSITGSVDGRTMEASLGFGAGTRIDIAGDVAHDEQSISGTYSVVRGGQCTGDRGTFRLVRD